MYYDNWSEKSFNQSPTGYCICQHCYRRIDNMRDPDEETICPHCNHKVYTPPEDYNIYKFNGTRKIDFKGDIGGIILTIILMAVFNVVAFFAGIMFLIIIGFIDVIILSAVIGPRFGPGQTKKYPCRIIGVSFAEGSLTQANEMIPDSVRERAVTHPREVRIDENPEMYANTLFVRYTVLFQKDSVNALTYIYDIAADSHFAINDTAALCIKNNNKAWLEDK